MTDKLVPTSDQPTAPEDTEQYLEILKSNLGFTPPEPWLGYARANDFKRVPAQPRTNCPDCGSDTKSCIGHFIYYSNRIGLQECRQCRLIYTDVLLATETTTSHFEVAYKDTEYFEHSRAEIFSFILKLVDERTPKSARVVDGGGAQGHLLASLAKVRPDLELVLNDISRVACEYVEKEFGLKTLCGPLQSVSSLAPVSSLLLIDSIYYEPKVEDLWQSLIASLAPGGQVIIRVPNKALYIKAASRVAQKFSALTNSPGQTTISGYNPEHVSIFTRAYLARRLTEGGMMDVEFFPSPLLSKSKNWQPLMTLCYQLANRIFTLSNKRWIVTPSMVVVAKRSS